MLGVIHITFTKMINDKYLNGYSHMLLYTHAVIYYNNNIHLMCDIHIMRLNCFILFFSSLYFFTIRCNTLDQVSMITVHLHCQWVRRNTKYVIKIQFLKLPTKNIIVSWKYTCMRTQLPSLIFLYLKKKKSTRFKSRFLSWHVELTRVYRHFFIPKGSLCYFSELVFSHCCIKNKEKKYNLTWEKK